jgi:hypothetical protein
MSTLCFSFKEQKGEVCADEWNKAICNVQQIHSTEIHCVFKHLLLNMAINVAIIDLHNVVQSG